MYFDGIFFTGTINKEMGYIFDDLSNEIMLLIFSFISEKDVCLNCSLVCQRWNILSADNSLIKARSRIQNGDDLTSIFEDICYSSDYLSFDYITNYVSKNYHESGVNACDLWKDGWFKSVQSRDMRIIKRINGYGIPHPTSRIQCDDFLFYLVSNGDLHLVKFLIADQSYTNHGFEHAIRAARDNQKLDIAEYLESLNNYDSDS